MSRLLISLFFSLCLTGCAPLSVALGISEHALITDLAEDAVVVSSEMIHLAKQKDMDDASQ